MKRRSFLAGLLALPLAPLVLGKEETALSRQHQKAIEFGARYGTMNLPEGAGKTKLPYVFVVADTYAEARQYIDMTHAHPKAAGMRYRAVSLSLPSAYKQFMGFRNCHVIVAGKLGRTHDTHVNLQKVKEEANRRNSNWYYPPQNFVIIELHDWSTV